MASSPPQAGENPERQLSKQESSPVADARDQWSYDESKNLVETQASDGVTYTFRSEKAKSARRVYFSMKVKRFSDIDTVHESFRARFHIYLNWIVTHKEYETYLAHTRDQEERRTTAKWEPKFKPRIEFVNEVQEHYFRSVPYPPMGYYRIIPLRAWLDQKDCGFDCKKTLFCRQKLECDLTFSEQMELRSFPFDCQDFTIVIRESSGTSKALLMPEPRYTDSERQIKSDFFKLDTTFSVLDEWDFYSTMLEVADSSSGASRSKSVYHEITVRFKMMRRWKVYMYNIVVYLIIITFISLTCFALDEEDGDLGERLNLAVTILLTLVAFQHSIFDKLPNIPYLTFIHKYVIISFMFVCAVIAESSLLPFANRVFHGFTFDVLASWLFGLFWLSYNVYFIFRAGWVRHIQRQKLLMDSDEIKSQIDEKYPQFLMSWKSLRMFLTSGNYDDWARQESELEAQEKQKMETTKDKKKSVCVMEFGGAKGDILTFVSYAYSDKKEEQTFCQYLCRSCRSCCLLCCCCGCCREDRDTNRKVQQRKQDAHALTVSS